MMYSTSVSGLIFLNVTEESLFSIDARRASSSAGLPDMLLFTFPSEAEIFFIEKEI